MQFVYEGFSYHLDSGSVAKDLELIYLKAIQGEEYGSLTEEQTLLLEVAWTYFANQYLEHENLEGRQKGQQLFSLMQMGYVENLVIDPGNGDLMVKLAIPAIVN